MDVLIERQAIIGFANELEQRALKLSNNDSEDILYKTVRVTIKAICEYCEKLPSVQPEQAVKGCRNCKYGKYNDHWKTHFCYNPNECTEWNLWEPSAQPEIIHCRNCKHWTETCGDKQWGLGDCDVFDKHLVMCNGYCAWAERREE